MKKPIRFMRVKAGLAVVAALGLAFSAASTASAGPHVIVTPSADLPATAEVTVEIYGFEPEEAVFVQQCATVKSSETVCHTSKETVLLNEEGEGTVQMTVRRVFVAHNEDGTSAGEIDCVAVDGCSVVVGNSEGGSAASISFQS
ncbi:enediyne antibiotic chromoprotein [Streptomyces xanthophaeus]|uniref:enediyne antibiotic chromoprotein n=1 Tax=Streptomyces xanthophaeus TaxID=67385 RepID=UPI00398FB02A